MRSGPAIYKKPWSLFKKIVREREREREREWLCVTVTVWVRE
jgi:hypothetical protein